MRVSCGRCAAREGNQSLPRTGYGVRFLLAVQLALPARPRSVIDGGLKSLSIFMVIRPAIFTDIQPPWERGELTIIRL